MKTKLFSLSCFIPFLLLLELPLFAEDKQKEPPLSVLVIGGGPAGLATAITAKAHGYNVTVIEKRDIYSRTQWVFLLDSSLELLEKWNVISPQMRFADLGEGNRIGFVELKDLEVELEKKAIELGVKKIHGEFQELKPNQTALIVTPEKNEVTLAYDILVGADGSHSSVRDALGIEKTCFGSAQGAAAAIADSKADSTKLEISPPIKHGNGFLRRMKVPSVSIVFMQSPRGASKNQFQKAVEMQGWSTEASAMLEEKAFVFANIDVSLHQAQTFSNEKKSAILVGDAAATASFFQGMGANTAFKTMNVADRFFKEMQTQNQAAFQNFNQGMKETTDALIENSAFLFTAAEDDPGSMQNVAQ